jgi:hypothetical protein
MLTAVKAGRKFGFFIAAAKWNDRRSCCCYKTNIYFNVKKLFLPIVIVLFSVSLRAQSRPDVDTISLFRLAPGMTQQQVEKTVKVPLQTLFMDPNSGTGILKYDGQYEEIKGEVRIALEKNAVSQVIFVATVPDTSHTKSMFNTLKEKLVNKYGDPDIDYYNVFREIRWDGMQRSIGVKAQDGSKFISLVLQQYQKRR